MEWTKYKQFEMKRIEKELPRNVTCQRCPSKPTEKPTPTYRGHRLMHVGTMCAGQTNTLECWVDLPDGVYIVRVGGDYHPNKANFLWSYSMAKTLPASTQMVVEIANDDCRILSHHTSNSFCQYSLKFDATVIVDVQLLIHGAALISSTTTSGSDNSNDVLVLTEALSSVVPGTAPSDVKIISLLGAPGEGVLVTAQIFMWS
jgi:hypothetical protein